ncbi:hypothetical protein D9756_005511 [Leucocoprinus leucothites]|uniref:RNA-dependent RNA polymerase n=1 Tax=Leucocoprinus leucothites TaxID=201217 RepID=A0A8H5G060_9AGAR|nr:hypothetical protein D9756_005511 [Leucoagaricus leucothites]
MEIFLRNIPADLDRFQVKAALAQPLHGPDFYNRQSNFDVHIFRPKPGEIERTGVVMIPDVDVGRKFWEAYGTTRPRLLLFFGQNRIYFSASNRPPPSPEVVEAVASAPWENPTWERVRVEQERGLEDMLVSLQSIQFGWMCRDDVFSIESEARQPAHLRFDQARREFHITVAEAYNAPTEYVIAIRQSSILSISRHSSQPDAQSIIFLQLEVPPSFFNRNRFPNPEKHEPYQRLTTLPVVNNPAAIPYTSLTLRLVLLSPDGTDIFDIISDLANIRNIVRSYPVQVARRNLFARNRLLQMDISIRQLDSWQVAFQLEALVRNLFIDPQEAIELVPEVKKLMKLYGKPFTAKLLNQFAPRAKDFLLTRASSSIISCFTSSVQEFRAQGDLEPDAPSDPNFYASLHVTITPTSMFLSGPFIDKSNRVIRRYSQTSQENFIRVEFRDENNLQYRFDKDIDSIGFIRARVEPIMRNGLVIAGRKFHFLAYSQSALREHSVWQVYRYGIVTAEKIIQSLGTFRGLEYDRTLEFCPARYGARISQAFSATDAAVVDVDEILIRDDIITDDGRYTFTDGSGGMSADIAREIWRLVGRNRDHDDFPRAYQIRFQGSKGMISVDHTLNGSNVLSLRRSMIKFDAPGSTEIEISRAVDQPTTYYLNRPLIMILEGLGVPYEVFQDFQDRAVRETQEATKTLSAAAHLLQVHGLGLSFRLPSTLLNLAKLNLEVLAQDPFFDQLLSMAVYHVIRDLKHRARIPIPNAWTLVGVADTHCYLQEDEVFVCIRHREKGVFYLEGPVLISRSPTIHPGDVQLATAIGDPPVGSCFAKEPLPNTVVFSRPLPTCLGGGDLDGDLYNIIPLKDHPYFAPKRIYAPADYLPPAKEYVDWPCTMMDVGDFVMKYIVSDVLGLVANNWLIIADQKGDITSPQCLELAKLHSDAVDYQKTGRQVELDSIPKPKFPRPDWSAPETIDNIPNQENKYYQSETALGKLTRNIDLKAHEPTLPPRTRPRRRAQISPGTVNDLADEMSSLNFLDKATSAIRGAVEPLVARFINTRGGVSPDISEVIAHQFRLFGDELMSIASRYSLSHRLYKPLLEEELIIGTITQKTTQPSLRREKIAKIKDASEYACCKVKEALEGNDDRAPREYLTYAWTAWIFSLREMRKGTFGAKAFWWVTIGTVFEAVKEVEEDEGVESRSTRSRRL